VVDYVTDYAPPFDTDTVTAEFAKVMISYGCYTARGDRVGQGWVDKAFLKYNITIDHKIPTKALAYEAFAVLIMNRRLRLLDDAKSLAQICSLQVDVRGSTKKIDARGGLPEDRANVIALSATEAVAEYKWYEDKNAPDYGPSSVSPTFGRGIHYD
jgi:hypothetical protein